MFDEINNLLAEEEQTDEEVDEFWREWLTATNCWPASQDSIRIGSKEQRAVHWLAKLSRNDPEKIIELLKRLQDGQNLYKKHYRIKKDGSKRIIHAPMTELMGVQKKINSWLSQELFPHKNVFGFSGGSAVNTIIPHLKNRTMLRADIVDAFPSVTSKDVFFFFKIGIDIYGPKLLRGDGLGHFSWYFSRIITQLTTRKKRLPQGAPTSPRIFDLVCTPMDIRLARLAGNVNGVYTRYADNIFFSMDCDSFPQKVRQAILKTIEGGRKRSLRNHEKGFRRSGPVFKWHKLSVGKVEGRMLGFNIRESEMHNTRNFKRGLRKAVHHLDWLLENGGSASELESAVCKLSGMMGHVRNETLPEKLLDDCQQIKEQIRLI